MYLSLLTKKLENEKHSLNAPTCAGYVEIKDKNIPKRSPMRYAHEQMR